MQQLKQLYDKIVSLKKDLPPEVWERLSEPMKAAGAALFTTRTFVYRGKAKCNGRATAIRLTGINMDFDDLIRLVCDKKTDLDNEVEIGITVFENDKPKEPVVLTKGEQYAGTSASAK